MEDIIDCLFREYGIDNLELVAKVKLARQEAVDSAKTYASSRIEELSGQSLERFYRCERLEQILSSIITGLPSNKDWLDPDIEKAANDLLENPVS